MKQQDYYHDWKPTDANVKAVADDETAFPMMRALAKEVIKLRELVEKLNRGERIVRANIAPALSPTSPVETSENKGGNRE